MKEKLFKNINQKDFEFLKKAADDYFKNVSYTIMKQDIIYGTYYFMKMIDESTENFLIEPSNTEKNIFDEFNDITLKTNEKILKDFMKDKFDRLNNKKSAKKDDMINGLRCLDLKKKDDYILNNFLNRLNLILYNYYILKNKQNTLL